MKTKVLKFNDYQLIKEVVNDNGVIAFPTETVYGLGIKYNSFLAYSKIFEIKQRASNKPLTLMLYDIKDINSYVLTNNKINRIINEFMPGALTIILPLKDNTDIIGAKDYLGIRIPDNEMLLSFLKNINTPMFVTSANISNNDDLLSYDDVYKTFNNKIDIIVDEKIPKSKASTVIKVVDDKIELLRQGPIDIKEIERVFNDE